uniref:Roadblock/LAMTOR2 domain-containing protein n=1 Tax=Glossina palpalis gambiensis TaxID=67801 RepID=A0A1B0APG6_9MUSC
MSQEVEETLKRIQSHKGVVGTIVDNKEGIPVKSTLDNTTTIQYADLMSQLADKARSVVRDLDSSNDLTFLRVRSKKHEIMMAPNRDFILVTYTTCILLMKEHNNDLLNHCIQMARNVSFQSSCET